MCLLQSLSCSTLLPQNIKQHKYHAILKMKFQGSPVKTNDLSKNVYLFVLHCSQVLGNLEVKHSINTGECGFKYFLVGSQTSQKH